MIPVSLLASMSETSAGRGSAASIRSRAWRSTIPRGATGTTAASGTAWRTESCSIAETMTRRPGRPRSASWFASVPPPAPRPRAPRPATAPLRARAARRDRSDARTTDCRNGRALRPSRPRPRGEAARSRSSRDKRCGAAWASEDGRLLRRERGVAALAVERTGAAKHALRDEIRGGHRAEIEMDLVAELFPEIMGEAARLAAAAADGCARRTARGADRLVDGEDDVGDARIVGAVAEEIAAAGSAHALDQTGGAQLGEKLLEIGQRDLLPLGDLGERDRAALAVLGEIDHRHHRVASLGAKPHGTAPFRAAATSRGPMPSSAPARPVPPRARPPAHARPAPRRRVR